MANLETRPDGVVIADVGNITSVVVDPTTMTVTGGTTDPNDAGYPDVIIDQRFGYAGDELRTVDDVEAVWSQALGSRRPPLPILPATDTVVPYVNHSRWVADCACGGGMFAWDRNPRTCCLDCGRTYWVTWDPPADRAAVIRALAARPPAARNWDPRRVDENGNRIEDLAFLERENVLMGVD